MEVGERKKTGGWGGGGGGGGWAEQREIIMAVETGNKDGGGGWVGWLLQYTWFKIKGTSLPGWGFEENVNTTFANDVYHNTTERNRNLGNKEIHQSYFVLQAYIFHNNTPSWKRNTRAKKKKEAEWDHNVNRHAEFRPIVLVYILHVQPTHNWQSVKASLWNTGCKTCHSLNSWRMVIIQKQTRKTHTKNQPAFHFSLATTAKPLNTRFHIQLITMISVQPVPDEENVVLLLSIFQHTRSPARTCYKQRSMPLTQKPTQPHTFSSMQLNTIPPPPPPPQPKTPWEKYTQTSFCPCLAWLQLAMKIRLSTSNALRWSSCKHTVKTIKSLTTSCCEFCCFVFHEQQD